ncbi:MAG: M14 family metallocarboxypeptidase [Shewanella sp.]
MVQENTYPIGVTGQKWGEAEKALWLTKQTIQRSYQAEVVTKIVSLADHFQIEKYGALSYNPSKYSLFVVKSKQWSEDKPTLLVTGGVHGYETSGVQGAIRFLQTEAKAYEDRFNILVAPCVSPWGYETINRWNPNTVDPNRSFYQESPAEESAALMAYIADLGIEITVHIDLHETTDTDNSAFRPALAARDAVEQTHWNIPDGFYLVGNTDLPAEEFQTAIIESVEKVTHIAPADDAGDLIGVVLSQWGVINYATKALGLCIGFSDSIYATTTEVYPDSPKVDDENCILAQVAAITGGLDYILPLS